MKKTFYHITAAVLTLGLASCAKGAVTPEQPVTPEPTGLITIVANIGDDASTKTTLSGDDQSGYDVLWSEGDQIRFYGGETVKEYFTYTLTEGAGTKSGVFTGPAVPESIDPTKYATYGDNLIFGYVGSLAEEQYYAPNNAAFSFPMAAKVSVSDGEVILGDFKNIGGLLRLDLKGSGTVKKIKISANQPLSGGAIRISEDGAAAFDSGAWLTSHKYVTLNCGASGVELTSEAKPFYISLLKNDYTGVKIEISDFAGHTFTKTLKADKSLNIERAQITPAAFTVTGLTNDNLPLTWDSPVGTRGILDGRECVVVDLGGSVGKVAVATKNIGAATETDYGTYYTWIDAVKAQKTESWGKGWHLFTHEEIDAFYESNWPHTVESGCVKFVFSETSSLIIPFSGYYNHIDGEYIFRGISGDFWGEEIVGLNPDMAEDQYCTYGLTVKDNGFRRNNNSCADKLTVRPVHILPMTRNTPVGMKARIGDRDAIVAELDVNGIKKKVAIAIKNEGAQSENMYYEQNGTKYLDCLGRLFTYREAESYINNLESEWYIPSSAEWAGLCSNYKYDIDVHGFKSTVKIPNTTNSSMLLFKITEYSRLSLPAAGFEDNRLSARGIRGHYWSSTEKDNDNEYVMWFHGSVYTDAVWPKNGYKLSLRLFHEMPR